MKHLEPATILTASQLRLRAIWPWVQGTVFGTGLGLAIFYFAIFTTLQCKPL